MSMSSSITRRTFFQGAALAASATRVIGANDRIQLGIVALGGRGRDHLRTYLTIPDSQIAGLCDVNQAARETAQAEVRRANQPQAKEFNDMRKLFESKDIDAVSIATPNHWHALSRHLGRGGRQRRLRREASQPQHLRRQPHD
jgi:hypothetical protein